LHLIGYLNPVLRGWANYHRYAVAKRTFAYNDSRIWFMLWQWAKRRHPNKGARWVKAKYFTTQRYRNWVFAAMVDPRKKQRLTLFLEGSIPIKWYNKIRMGANPHDPDIKRKASVVAHTNVAGTKYSQVACRSDEPRIQNQLSWLAGIHWRKSTFLSQENRRGAFRESQ